MINLIVACRVAPPSCKGHHSSRRNFLFIYCQSIVSDYFRTAPWVRPFSASAAYRCVTRI